MWALAMHLGGRPEVRRSAKALYYRGLAVSVGPVLVLSIVLALGPLEGAVVFLPFLTAVAGLSLWQWFFRHYFVPVGLEDIDDFDAGSLGRHSLTLSPDGVAEKRPHSEISHPWRSVTKIDDAPDHIFLEVVDGSHYIVPKRGLHHEAIEVFLGEARKYSAASRSGAQ